MKRQGICEEFDAGGRHEEVSVFSDGIFAADGFRPNRLWQD